LQPNIVMGERIIDFFKAIFRRPKKWWAKRPAEAELLSLKDTVKENYELWQKWQENLEASRQSLVDILETATMAARQVGVPHPKEVGLLAKAAYEVLSPYTRPLLQKHATIKLAFALLEPNRKDRIPKETLQQLEEYRLLVEQRRQQYQQLHNRLSLIITLLEQLIQQAPWGAALPHQLLLEHPEIFEARLAMKRLHWENQQICLKRLQNTFKNRLKIGESWLFLLKKHITTYAHRLGRRTLNELGSQFSNEENQDLNFLKNLHRRLDAPLLNWNRQAIKRIGLPPF